jgi:hypothetical protein
MQGDPLPINLEHGMTFCIETIDLLTRAVIRPQYVVFGSIGCLGNRGETCEQLCQFGMQRLKHEDGGNLYELVRVYDDVHVDLLITEDFMNTYTARNNYLYRLRDEY